MKRAVLITYAPVVDDPRVRRLGDALHGRGWEVIGIGLCGGLAPAPAWRVIACAPSPGPADRDEGSRAERMAGSALALALAPGERLLDRFGSAYKGPVRALRQQLATEPAPLQSLLRRGSKLAARRMSRHALSEDEALAAAYRKAVPEAGCFMEEAGGIEGPALWIANDWQALPAAAHGASSKGGALCYDSHELATEQYAEHPDWVRFVRPAVAAVERRHVPEAKVVSTVSPGIARVLKRDYRLKEQPLTVHNTPYYERSGFRPTPGERIRLLYQGAVIPGRGLEVLIESASLWRKGLELTIRGPAKAGYLHELRALSRSRGDPERVTFADPVPVTDLVSGARSFDVGLMFLPGLSEHKRLALPNKLFEYMMGGLALGVTDLPEMGRLLQETGAGFSVPSSGLTPVSLAGVLNALEPQDIDRMKRCALEAAGRYHFEATAAPLIAAYEELDLGQPVTDAGVR